MRPTERLLLLAPVCMLAACGPCAPEQIAAVCEPGATQLCVCTSGQEGAQRCNPEGTAWGPCGCEGGGDAGNADSGSPDAGVQDAAGRDAMTGASLSLRARAVSTCGSWAPDLQPELHHQTPAHILVGVQAVELLRDHLDPAPVALPLAAPIVERDLSAGSTLAEVDIGLLPAGSYSHVRVTLAWSSYDVQATAHQGTAIDGTLTLRLDLSDHEDAQGTPHDQGDYLASFGAYGQSFSFSGSTELNCTLSTWGGIASTAGSSFAVRVPLPDAPLVIDPDTPRAHSVELRFPVQDIFAWRDQDRTGFADGVLDLSPLPAESEMPDTLVECNLLMADRCLTAAVAPVHPTWSMPDSSVTFCTDGTQIATSCPAPGETGFGQDASYQIHPPAFTTQAGTVLDEVTGLLWQQSTPAETFDWWQARAYCESLDLGGRDSWRLPSRVELVSLLDFGVLDPVIDLEAFPGTTSDFYWTGSPVPFLNMAYGVRFELGFIYDHDPYGTGRVRCVSGAYQAPAPRFSFDADLVLDQGTGLQWQRLHHPTALGWVDALAHCEGLSLGGHDDWRLPSLKELQTLVDERRLQPCIDVVAFPATPPEWFWSSTPISVPPDQAWATSYTDGYASIHEDTELHLVRCVR